MAKFCYYSNAFAAIWVNSVTTVIFWAIHVNWPKETFWACLGRWPVIGLRPGGARGIGGSPGPVPKPPATSDGRWTGAAGCLQHCTVHCGSAWSRPQCRAVGGPIPEGTHNIGQDIVLGFGVPAMSDTSLGPGMGPRGRPWDPRFQTLLFLYSGFRRALAIYVAFGWIP